MKESVESIKNAVKNSFGGKVMDVKYTCGKCNEVTVVSVDFSNGTYKCHNCNSDVDIEDQQYIAIFEDLKSVFGDNIQII
ncbi:hypothetical protein [Radiobacillus sp. PE A8.2]|uniref:hypothetical protein n=1 Tax=Radiobacillus sp. PE A8.2 TaxID=3380349 RepID=UPI00388D1BE1